MIFETPRELVRAVIVTKYTSWDFSQVSSWSDFINFVCEKLSESSAALLVECYSKEEGAGGPEVEMFVGYSVVY